MRQFILTANTVYGTGTNYNEVPEGAIAFFHNETGVPKITISGRDIKSTAMLVLGRSANNGGPISIPIHKHNFSYVKGTYAPATTFSASITIPDGDSIGSYTLMVVKKGVPFNERNKWSTEFYSNSVNVPSIDLVNTFVKNINSISSSIGIIATISETKLVLTATKKGIDYDIIVTDNLSNAVVTITTPGTPAYGDAEYIKDLANKAAADAGFEYTYKDSYAYLYPNYPLNPLVQPDKADTGFTIYTLRFSEPRKVKTREEVVDQVVQVAFPTGSESLVIFESVCSAIAYS